MKYMESKKEQLGVNKTSSYLPSQNRDSLFCFRKSKLRLFTKT